MTYRKLIGAGIAALIAAAGIVPTASAQLKQPDRTTDIRTMSNAPDFRSVKWLDGRDVMNDNSEHVATLGDLILDRGSGRIEYAVLKTGTILGMGGRRVAVPYASLRWDGTNEHFVLGVTPEQLKQYPEFSEDEWKGVSDTGANANALRQRLTTDSARTSGDPYAQSIANAKEVRVQGEVTKVERVPSGDFGEQVVVTVKSKDGNEHRIALGPSWFVNSGDFAPMRGDQVSVDAITIDRDPDKTVAAKSVRSGDRNLTLRSDDGSPAWSATTKEESGQRSHTSRRYLLLSSLMGAKVDCRGNECGKVYDAIMERGSGALAFLSIDPNQNFLGIGDTKRLVPWSVASVGADGVVRIDASKSMVLSSPETPSDPAMLNSSGTADLAYKAYDVSPPRFEPARPVPPGPAMADRGAWSRDGTICKAIRKDAARTVTGKSEETRDVVLGNGIPDARAISVNEDGKDVLVLLGPAWYIKNQSLPCDRGSAVTIQTYRTTIAGKDYLIARSIECGGSRMDLLDESGSPAWDKGNQKK